MLTILRISFLLSKNDLLFFHFVNIFFYNFRKVKNGVFMYFSNLIFLGLYITSNYIFFFEWFVSHPFLKRGRKCRHAVDDKFWPPPPKKKITYMISSIFKININKKLRSSQWTVASWSVGYYSCPRCPSSSTTWRSTHSSFTSWRRSTWISTLSSS